jgi:hypothetical protein
VVGFLLFRPDTLFTNVPVNESLEEAFAETPTSSTTEVTETTARASPTTTTSTAADAPEVVLSGSFTGIDHRAEGSANIYQSGDRFVLRFEEDTDIQNGPDLFVWLLAADSYDGGVPGNYLDLGVLTGNVGSQNYELPDTFDPAIHRTILIWCRRFAVPFADAPLG